MSKGKSKLRTIAGLFHRKKPSMEYMKGQVYGSKNVVLKEGDTLLLYRSNSKDKREQNKWYLKIEEGTEEAADSSE